MIKPLHLFTGLSLAISLSLLTHPEATAQTQNTEKRDIYTFVEQMPEFKGGEAAMMQHLAQNLRYTEGLPGGLVVASFVVNPDSSVSDVAIVKGLHPELEQESIRVLESMSGKWIPGRQNGKLVAVRFILPIRFEGGERKEYMQKKDLQERGPAGSTQKLKMAETDVMPEYKEGTAQLLSFISKNRKYNKANSPTGFSHVSFIVNEDGSLSDFTVVKSLAPALDQEAIRVLTLTSGNWKPGMQQGNPVKVRFTMPVRF